MLYYLALLCALAGIAFGQDYKAEHLGLGLQNPYGLHNNMGLWKPVEVVGEAGGCCLPSEMEAMEGMMMAEVNKGRPSVILSNMHVSVSSKLRKIFLDVFQNIDGQGMHMKVWQDFTAQTQYNYNVQKSTCQKSPLGPWKPLCIPAGAHLLGNVYFGNQVGANKINSSWYQTLDKNTGLTAFISMTRTKKNECIPVTESAFGNAKGVPFALTTDFMNIVPKVRDPKVFDVPSVCTSDDVQEIPKQDAFGGSIFFR